MRFRIGSIGAFALLALGVLQPGAAGADPFLLSVSRCQSVILICPPALLRTVDAADGSTVSASVTITVPGPPALTVRGATGLAQHPQTGTFFALLQIQGRSFPELVTLDETTGIATSIGNTSDKFAGIAFAADGTLYGVSGDGGAVPESLYTLSTADASATLVLQLGNGSDGETIAFNPDDGLLYHASGIGQPNQSANGEILEKIDLVTLNVTNVPLSGFDYEELASLTFSQGGFYAGDLGDSAVDMPGLLRITTGGAVTFLGDLDHVARGLAPVLPPPAIPAVPTSLLGLLAVSLLALGRQRLPASSV